MEIGRRARGAAIVVLLVVCGLVIGPIAPTRAEPARSVGPFCGPGDDPAVGCGIRVVGRNDVLGRGNNFNLAKIGHCAYVSSSSPTAILAKRPVPAATDGIAVLDVRHPSHPRLATILRTPGASDSAETIHAVDAGRRKVLVVGAYGGKTSGHPLEGQVGPALDVYDVSGDCAAPRHMSTVYWPDNAHNVTINPSGTRVYGTRFAPNPTTTAALALSEELPLGAAVTASPIPLMNVMVMDIGDLARPRLAADVPLRLPDGTTALCHNVNFNESETRMYCAGRVSARAAPDGREQADSTWRWAGPSIWDVSEIAKRRPNPVVRFVSESAIKGQGGHHAVPATINGRRYLVAANELAFTCDAAAYPRIWDVTDEAHPRAVSELHVPAPEVCAGNHYNNVDDSRNTKMAIIGWTTAGLRVFDIRHPNRPREIAYFKPETYTGDPNPFAGCKSVVYLDKPTGQLWFACDGGFYVVELTPRVRGYMGLATRAASPHAITTSAWRARLLTEPAAPRRSAAAAVGLYCALP